MKTTRMALAFTLLLLTTTTALHAQVPQLVNYQGRVAVGTPPVNFDGTGQFRFALVDAAGTTTYWNNAPDTTPADGVPDSAVSLTVTKGLYSVLLGDTSITNMAAIPASVWSNADVRLRVWFNDGANGIQLVSPDQRLAPNGYLPDGSVSSTALASGAVTSAKIATGAVTNTQLATNAVQTANIDASAVATGNLGNGAVTAAKLGSDVGLWSVNGGNVYRVAGNVGVSTTNPSARLEVESSDQTTTIFAHNLGGGAGNQPALRARVDALSGTRNIIQAENGNGTVFLVRDDGNVGIGTSTPAAKLHIRPNAGSGAQPTSIRVDMTGVGDGSPNSILLGADGPALGGIAFVDTTKSGVAAETPLSFRIGGSEKMRLSPNGNVGIGTTSPAGKLEIDADVFAGNVLYLRNPLNSWASAALFNSYRYITTTAAATDGNWRQFNVGAGGVSIGYSSVPTYGSSDALYVNGRAGIGTSAPATSLEVAGNDNSAGQVGAFRISRADTPAQGLYMGYDSGDYGYIQPRFNGVGNRHLILCPNGGNVGIFTTGPLPRRLTVNGDVQCEVLFHTGLSNISDARYKTNVQPLNDALDKVLRLRGVNFDWRREEFPEKHFSPDRQIGFIAQEVREVFPNVVSEGPDGYLSVAYTAIIPVLAEALKDLHRKHATDLRAKDAEIAALKKQLAAQEERDRAIEARLGKARVLGLAVPEKVVLVGQQELHVG
ncbi:MAG: tail fiber domain-containing protein, partial [Chthoniobacteraceae bacterium]